MNYKTPNDIINLVKSFEGILEYKKEYINAPHFKFPVITHHYIFSKDGIKLTYSNSGKSLPKHLKTQNGKNLVKWFNAILEIQKI